MLKIGSLCTGYGGLDMAVEAYFGAETVWTSDIDKYASMVIKERIGKPNLGDLKVIDWTQLEPIDILTAGYPCQPFSHAGQRKGTQDERHIWPYINKAIGILRPSYVILENVRGHLSLGFKEVLKDLAKNGYDAEWRIVRASDAGAPHRRERLFIVAQPANTDSVRGEFRVNEAQRNQRESQFEPCQCSQVITYTNCGTCEESRRTNRGVHATSSQIIDGANRNEYGSGGKIITDTESRRSGFQSKRNEKTHAQLRNDVETIAYADNARGLRHTQGSQGRFDSRTEMRLRRTPNPLDLDGKLNAVFVEYMMGLPEGWVTDLNISRSQQLKILGNGVVPQQAYLALQLLLGE